MTELEYIYKYRPFFEAVAAKFPIAKETALKLSYELTKPQIKILKINNFFAVANNQTKKFKQFNTPFEGIEYGLKLIVNNPKFTELKLGTLKANPELQTKKILSAFYND
jgi:hypothetical protein